jgi:predicted GNAT family N-acyltransferase
MAGAETPSAERVPHERTAQPDVSVFADRAARGLVARSRDRNCRRCCRRAHFGAGGTRCRHSPAGRRIQTRHHGGLGPPPRRCARRQRLRYDVFVGEMGARVSSPLAGHDIDLFDDFCEHLLVRDELTQQVIGTYRVLTPAQARRVGSTYSDTEFDLTRLRDLRERMVELGRSCVHPEHRQGGVILALWGALAGFMHRNKLDRMKLDRDHSILTRMSFNCLQ